MTSGSVLRSSASRLAFALAATALAAMPAGVAAAESGDDGGFSIEGSIRARVERIEGEFRPGKLPEETIYSTQTSILAKYKTGPVTFAGELLDARGYDIAEGSAASSSTVNVLEPLQAYVALDVGQEDSGWQGDIQAGRFTMKIGSGRIIGRPGFSNAPTAFTGAKLDLANSKGERVTAFWTMPVTRQPGDAASIRDNEFEFDRSGTDLQLFGASYQSKLANLGATFEVYGYGLIEDDRPDKATRNRNLYTPGVRFSRKAKPGKLDFDVELAYQIGSIREGKAANAGTQDVAAWFLHTEIGHTFEGPANIRVAAMFDIATGDADGGNYTRFDPLFGARRGTFGHTANCGPLSFSNIISPGLRVSTKPTKRLDGWVSARLAWLEEGTDSFAKTGIVDPAGAAGNFAGAQIEGSVRYWVVPETLRFEVGAAYFAKGRFMETAPNAPQDGDTRYVFADVTFNF